MPEEGDERLRHQSQVVLKEQNLPAKTVRLSPMIRQPDLRLPEDLETLIGAGYRSDPLPNKILEALKGGADRHLSLSFTEYEEKSGRLFYRGRLYIPESDKLKAKLFCRYYDAPVARHLGKAKTYELLAREFYWLGML